MFNVRPDKRWFGIQLEPPEDPPGFRLDADGLVRGALPSAAVPDSTMFNVRREQDLPGLHNFRPPEEVVPGFRINADGSIRDDTAPTARRNPGGGNFFDQQSLGGSNFIVGRGSMLDSETVQTPSMSAFSPPFSSLPPSSFTGIGAGTFPPDEIPSPAFRQRVHFGLPGADGQQPAKDSASALASSGSSDPSGGRASHVSNLLFNPSAPQTFTPVSCTSADGTFSCTTPGGTSFGPLPAPRGFPDITPDIRSHHEYRYESDPIYNPKEVMRQVTERPTLGPSDLVSPATREGTANEATPQPYYTIAEALKAAAGMRGLQLGPVKSHVTEDQHGNVVVVNVTEPGHKLFPGYVVHYIIKSDDGSYRLVTEGEGLGLLQRPDAPEALRDFLNRKTWQKYHKGIIERSK